MGLAADRAGARRARLLIFGAASACIAWTNVLGQGASPNSTPAPLVSGSDPASGGMSRMTIREMVGCGQKLIEMETREDEIRKGDVSLSGEMAYLKVAGHAIDVDRAHINTRDEKQIAFFNHKIALYQGLVDKFNAEVEQRNGKAGKIHADSNDFDVNCAHRPYNPEDLRSALERVSTRQQVPLFFQPSPPPDNAPAPAPTSPSASAPATAVQPGATDAPQSNGP